MNIRILPIAFALAAGLALSHQAAAQMVAEVSTNKAVYDLGEAIELTITVTNTGAETVSLSTYCNSPTFDIGDVALDYPACVTYTHNFVFPPGSWRSWTWEVAPNVYGLPTTSGQHEVVVHFAHLADTVTIEAPRYPGGRLTVGFSNTADADTLEAIRADLQATVLESHALSNSFIELWEISGVGIEEAVERYQGHAALNYIEPYRFILETISVATEPEAVPRTLEVSPAYPNPFRTSTQVGVRVQAPQRVRVEVFDLLGRSVAVLHDAPMAPGTAYVLRFDPGALPSGTYLYRVAGEAFTESGTMLRVR